jgi:hypothetical protein
MPYARSGPFYLADADANPADLSFPAPAKTKRQRREMLDHWLSKDLADTDIAQITRVDESDFRGYEYFERV